MKQLRKEQSWHKPGPFTHLFYARLPGNKIMPIRNLTPDTTNGYFNKIFHARISKDFYIREHADEAMNERTRRLSTD
jgi:hypothetical protein